MHRGYVKLWRRSLDSPIWDNPNLWRFWTWCLLKATYKERNQMVGFQEIPLSPGQFVFGRKMASEETGLTERNIRTCVKTLKSTSNLTIKVTNKFSIIQIQNWELYQQSDQQKANKVTSKRPASDQQVTTNKKDKKDKKDKNIYIEQFEKFWELWPKKMDKHKALKAFIKIAPTNGLFECMLEAIKAQTVARDWNRDNWQYIPNPTTWLNGKRWTDEVITPSKPQKEPHVYG